MSNQCHALLRRTDGRPRRKRWCQESPAPERDFICELGHVTRRPVCARHTPVNGRPVNGDLWVCRHCPVIAAEGQVFLSAWDEERREAELLSWPVQWVHYVTDADHRRRTRGREREGHLLTLGRSRPAWAQRQNGRGRAVWIAPDDRWSDRLFVKAWWDPDRPELNYSLEEWQGVGPPMPSDPIAAAPYYGDHNLYECDQYLAEMRANDDQVRKISQSQPLMSDDARRIWIDGIVDQIEQASEAVLTELQLLLEDDERYRELLARNDELLNLVDRCLRRHDAAATLQRESVLATALSDEGDGEFGTRQR
jgi:hypothetical protein